MNSPTLTVKCPLETQCPRYRGCLQAIFYATEAIKVRSINAGLSTVKKLSINCALLRSFVLQSFQYLSVLQIFLWRILLCILCTNL